MYSLVATFLVVQILTEQLLVAEVVCSLLKFGCDVLKILLVDQWKRPMICISLEGSQVSDWVRQLLPIIWLKKNLALVICCFINSLHLSVTFLEKISSSHKPNCASSSCGR